MSKIASDINRGEMLGCAETHTGDCYGDGTVYRGERSKDSETPTLDVQSTMEMLNRAYKSKCFELEAAELEVKRLRALVEHTYYINDAGNLCQRLMDNLTADMARDILESLK